MKQEHEMTPGVLVSGEVLSAGDARARVAVLEAENADLRKRVCVPDGYVVVPSAVVEFLKGAGQLEGLWFGESGIDRGAFWWRKYLFAIDAAPAPVERLATDGGRNQRFEGLFEGETPDQRNARLASAVPVERNQCDGCQAGIPVESGMHRMGKPGGYADLMACAADRYGSAPVERVEQEAVATVEVMPDQSQVWVALKTQWLPVGLHKLYTAPQPAPTAAQDVAGLVDAAHNALREIEAIMHEAYNSAEPVCCGQPGLECCGSPIPEWSDSDQRMMDRLAPHQRALNAVLAAHQQREGIRHD